MYILSASVYYRMYQDSEQCVAKLVHGCYHYYIHVLSCTRTLRDKEINRPDLDICSLGVMSTVSDIFNLTGNYANQ